MTTMPPDPQDPMGGPPPGYGAPPPPPPGYDGGYGMPPQPAAGWGGPQLAEWPHRAGGALIDMAIGYVPYLLFARAVPALAYLLGIGIWLYLQYMQGTTGQTPGKKVLGTKLLREADGQVVGFGLAVGRSILHILDALPCLVGYLWPLWDAKKQTFADKIVSTVVVKA